MKVYGLTGGIGMGKSAAARLLQERGIPVVDSDVLAREIVEPGQPALEEISQVFGSHVVDSAGQLDRAELAKIVFSDPTSRQKLEAITHPRIQEKWKQQISVWQRQGNRIAVVVIPLLFETNAEQEFDATICVACSAATQAHRLEVRGWTPGQIRQRIAAQWPAEKKIAKSDFVIWNETGLDVLVAQLDKIVRP